MAWREWIVAILANISGTVAGTSIAWPSPVYGRLTAANSTELCQGPVTSGQFALIGSLFFVGAAMGAFIGAYGAKSIGRRTTLFAAVGFMLISWVLKATATCIVHFYVSQTLSGIAISIIVGVNTMYVAEIAPAKWRGALCSFMQIEYYLGTLFVQALGPYVSLPVLSWSCLGIVVVWAIGLSICPESPIYLVDIGRRDKALRALACLRGDPVLAEAEVDKIQPQQSSWKVTIPEMCACNRSPPSRGLALMCCLAILQQCSGISVIIMNEKLLFEAGGGDLSPELSTVIVCLVQLLSSCICPLLVDVSGRRPLLLLSAAGTGISLLTLAGYMYALEFANSNAIKQWGFICQTSVIVFVIMFCVGYGPIPPVMMAEMFATLYRPPACAIVMAIGWSTAFFMFLIWHFLQTIIGFYVVFFIFACASAVGFIFIILFIPETKGRTFQQITEILSSPRVILGCSNRTVDQQTST